MVPLTSGLFAASSASAAVASGYANVWVRDNVYVAYSYHVRGQSQVAVRVARALLRFFSRHRHRFERIIDGSVNPGDVSQRPHIRFNGVTLEEITTERWPHAQNDALGYALWLTATLVHDSVLELHGPEHEMLALFPQYFNALPYWEDEDSGHWEETRKISASSIGTVVAGLEALVLAGTGHGRAAQFSPTLIETAARLAERGRAALRAILPHECVQSSPSQHRSCDAALLFLLYPLGGIQDQSTAARIVRGIQSTLAGEHGIRRYRGDSYWAPDYEERLAAEDRTRDYSDDLTARDALLEREGEEAQWCLFDPMLSAFFGGRFRHTGAAPDLELQTYYFRRSLSQVTASWQCPELYYLRRGEYVANPHTPLLWTQANLAVALHAMRQSLER